MNLFVVNCMDSLGKKGQVPCVSVALAGSGWKPHQGM